jgi:hypothetical protein
MAAVIYLIIARSVLDPIEELTTATKRDREGETPLPAQPRRR